MANRFVFPNQQRFDGNGNPLSGGKLGFFEVGTTTRKDTYSDEALSVPNTNPVVADANGVFGDIYMDGSYKVQLTDADDVQIFVKDNVAGPLFNAIGSGADDIPTNAFIGAFVPSIVDSGTDAYQADFGRDVSAGEKVTGDVGSANETTTPAMANTAGTPGSLTVTTKDGSALWQDALSGVHDFQLADDEASWLVLDPNPSQQRDLARAATDTARGDVELATSAETQTGTDTDRAVTPAGAAATYARIATGTYTGDGTTSQSITGLGFAPVFVKVWERSGTNSTDLDVHESTPEIVDDNADGGAVAHFPGGHEFRTNRIISLDSDGFTVDDAGSDSHPNTDGQQYNYMAMG